MFIDSATADARFSTEDALKSKRRPLLPCDAWTLTAQDYWDRFGALLINFPPGRERVDFQELQRWPGELADFLN